MVLDGITSVCVVGKCFGGVWQFLSQNIANTRRRTFVCRTAFLGGYFAIDWACKRGIRIASIAIDKKRDTENGIIINCFGNH